MPNQKGGKNYKKSKHTSAMKPVFIERQPDQMYARVVKNLGNRNLLVYCNDNKVRLAHIRGSMRKRVWLGVGDIVLISLREFEKSAAESATKQYDKSDIVCKYSEELLGRLKKEPDVNKKLFQQLETMDGTVLAEIGRKEQELGINLGEDNGSDIEFGEADASADSKSHEEDSDVDIDDI